MEGGDENEAIETFTSITGADAPTARHVLEAHGWDLNRGIEFFLESSNAPTARQPAAEGSSRTHAGGEASAGVVDLASDGEDERGLPPTFRAPAAPANPPSTNPTNRLDPPEFDEDDDELRAALNASLHTGDGDMGAPIDLEAAPRWAPRDQYDGDDGDVRAVNHPAETQARAPGLLDSDEEDLPSRRVRRNRPRGAALPDPYLGIGSHGGSRGAASGAQRDWPPALIVDGQPAEVPLGFPLLGRHGPQGVYGGEGFPLAEENGNGLSHLPDGINMEEARMLEAAMLGVPYEGRIPDFTNPTPPEPVSPTVMHHRQLREEQDQAYQDSLQADKLKSDAEESEKRAAEQRRQEQERIAEDAAQAQRGYEREIEEKLMGLPQEPGVEEEGVVTVMVRAPQGNRFGRRFRRTDLFASLFDFVDVSAAPDFRPGQYRLVTQFPRRVFAADTSGSLEEGGLTQKQEAVFLELL